MTVSLALQITHEVLSPSNSFLAISAGVNSETSPDYCYILRCTPSYSVLIGCATVSFSKRAEFHRVIQLVSLLHSTSDISSEIVMTFCTHRDLSSNRMTWSIVFWDETPCSCDYCVLLRGCFLWHILWPWILRLYISATRQWSTRLHGVTSHNTVFFIITAVRPLRASGEHRSRRGASLRPM
jgi:hypothetical protein